MDEHDDSGLVRPVAVDGPRYRSYISQYLDLTDAQRAFIMVWDGDAPPNGYNHE